MANSYLNIDGISDALAAALERHDQRRQRFNANVDTAFQGLSDTMKTALEHHRRNKVLSGIENPDNDPELDVAKEHYRLTGDPSYLVSYEQGRRQAAMMAAQNESSRMAAENDAKKLKMQEARDRAVDEASLLAPLHSARAVIDRRIADGTINDNEALGDIAAYENARHNLEVKYPDSVYLQNYPTLERNASVEGGKTGEPSEGAPNARAALKEAQNLLTTLEGGEPTDAGIALAEKSVEGLQGSATAEEVRSLSERLNKVKADKKKREEEAEKKAKAEKAAAEWKKKRTEFYNAKLKNLGEKEFLKRIAAYDENSKKFFMKMRGIPYGK